MPTSFIDIIKKSINECCLVKGNLLEERNTLHAKKTFHMSIQIKQSSKVNFQICKFDPNKITLFPYFSDLADIQKICDYFVFAEMENKKVLFLIELKRNKNSPAKQLKFSESFAWFILKRIELANNFDMNDVRIRKLGIKESLNHRKSSTQCHKDFCYTDGYAELPSNYPLYLTKLINTDWTMK